MEVRLEQSLQKSAFGEANLILLLILAQTITTLREEVEPNITTRQLILVFYP